MQRRQSLGWTHIHVPFWESFWIPWHLQAEWGTHVSRQHGPWAWSGRCVLSLPSSQCFQPAGQKGWSVEWICTQVLLEAFSFCLFTSYHPIHNNLILLKYPLTVFILKHACFTSVLSSTSASCSSHHCLIHAPRDVETWLIDLLSATILMT